MLELVHDAFYVYVSFSFCVLWELVQAKALTLLLVGGLVTQDLALALV
ncbi:hypothetical protein [Salmonella sp. s58078]